MQNLGFWKFFIIGVFVLVGVLYFSKLESVQKYLKSSGELLVAQGEYLKKDESSKKSSENLKILFVGDMMFDRTIRTIMEREGEDHIFSCISDNFKKYDLVVGNLEGPITSNHSVSVGTLPGDSNNMRFTFPAYVSDLLYKNNVRAVSIANNHIFDFGREGVEETKKLLRASGVSFFGDATDINFKTYIYKNVAIVGFNQFLGTDTVDLTMAEISKFSSAGYLVVVFAHWGEEYESVAEYQREWAHSFVDAGASLVIGAHPHVIQGFEKYKNATIYYSLGNFIFDQWWEEKVRKGMGVELIFDNKNISTKEIYFESSRDGRTCLES